MRIEKRYFTFMNQQVDEEEEAEIAERQEYEDVALAVKKACENTDCEKCPFYNDSRCVFKRVPRSWILNFNEFHDYDMQMRTEQEGWFK